MRHKLPGEVAGQCLQWGTKEPSVEKAGIGHSNRGQFYFAKRSKFFSLRSCPNYFFSRFLPQLSRAISLSSFAVVCPRALTKTLWCLLLNLSFLRVFPRTLRLFPFLKASSGKFSLASGSLGLSLSLTKYCRGFTWFELPGHTREPTCAVPVSAKRAD